MDEAYGVGGLAGSRPTGDRLSQFLGGANWKRDLLLPGVLLVVQVGMAVGTVGHHKRFEHLDAADWPLLVMGPAALAVRRRWPVAVLWVAFAATLAPSSAWTGYLSLIVAFVFAAVHGHRRAAWVVLVTGYVAAVWLTPWAYGEAPTSLTFALGLAGWMGALVVATEVVRLQRDRAVTARAARELDARRRASEERLRMARDLHDVIGHNVSLINVQAAVALDLMDARPEQARIALSAIENASRDALDELRTMLATLRRGGDMAPRAPAPSLERLEDLVELTRSAGLAVDLVISGERRHLPAAVDLAAYRVVQESLTNVARHAAGATTQVQVRYQPEVLEVVVTNDGPPGLARNEQEPGSGTGIEGMRERVTALGGGFRAGFRPRGGFEVVATIPLEARP
jgi:signal transduction histidine kinase